MRRVALLAAVLVLAACGSTAPVVRVVQPTLPRALAAQLRVQSAAVASALADGDGCTAQARAVALHTSVVDAINAHRVPPRFQETLLSTVADIAARIVCTPPPAPTPPAAPEPQPPGHGHGHGHGKGHEKHGGDD